MKMYAFEESLKLKQTARFKKLGICRVLLSSRSNFHFDQGKTKPLAVARARFGQENGNRKHAQKEERQLKK